MAILALENLHRLVSERLADRDPEIEVDFGWKQPAQKSDAHRRVVWVPGDEGGMLGSVGSAKYPGRGLRPLYTLGELFSVYLIAFDPTAPDGPGHELAQYKAARHLYDRWLAAVHSAAFGTFETRSARWLTDKREFRRGAALLVVGVIQAMVPEDPPVGRAKVNAAPVNASVTDTLGTTEETLTVNTTGD